MADGANCDLLTKELAATGRAIGPDLLAAWHVALRAVLRRAIRNIMRLVGGKNGFGKEGIEWLTISKLFRLAALPKL